MVTDSDYRSIRRNAQKLVHACREVLWQAWRVDGVPIKNGVLPRRGTAPKGNAYVRWVYYENEVTVAQEELRKAYTVDTIKAWADRLVYASRKAEYYSARLETTESGEIVIPG